VWFGGVYGNPKVFFDPDHPPSFPMINIQAHSMPFGSEYYPESTPQELLISSPVTDSNCNALPSFSEYPEIAAVGVTTDATDGSDEYWLHSPSFDLLNNGLSTPLMDGGKMAVELTKGYSSSQYRADCSNAPRTFLNEDTCTISYDACIPKDVGDKEFVLDKPIFKELYTGSGGPDGDETRYVYVVDNLRQQSNKDDPPCQNGARSRWRLVQDASCTQEVGTTTNQIIAELIAAATAEDSNPYMRDIVFPVTKSCDAADASTFDFRVQVNGECWLNTHVDNLQVFDFTEWTYDDTHPGNSDKRNPIEEFAENDSFILVFPSWHDMGRYVRKALSICHFTDAFLLFPSCPIGGRGRKKSTSSQTWDAGVIQFSCKNCRRK
jgi:hypothetical protein